MEYKWDNWINFRYFAEDNEEYSVVDWAEAFIHNGLVPVMKKRGYSFPTNEHGIVTNFLNYLFHFEESYNNNEQYLYFGKHGRKMNWSIEDYAFFLDVKCPDYVWEQLRSKFYIEHFTDDSDFANRLWTDIPAAIFFMIDLKSSRSSDELDDRLAWMEADDEYDGYQKRKLGVDPYLLDYGKNRYKYVESDTRL